MSQCWRFTGQGVNNSAYYEYFVCGTNAYFQSNGSGYLLYIDGNNLGGSGYYYRNGTQSVSAVSSDAPTSGYITSGNCSGCKPTLYDCLNGNCVQSTQYNTPGKYSSLSDCQAVCANGGACASGKQCVDPTTFCPSGQVCIGQDEYISIQGLISKLNSEVC